MFSAASLTAAVQYMRRVPVTLTIGALALFAAAAPSAAEILQYDRARILSGELWRLATCHVTHWSAEHLQWDLLMFVVLGVICELRNSKRMRLCVAVGAAAVSATVLVFFPAVEQYRGLSGVDTALFTLLAIRLIADARRDGNHLQLAATGICFMGFLGKTCYEALAGSTFFVDAETAGFVPLVGIMLRARRSG